MEIKKMADKILSEENIDGKYILRTVLVDMSDCGDGTSDPFEMKKAYSLNGDYVGDEDFAKLLVKEGIKPELKTSNSNICSIGFCESEKKYYGWSHRAMYGFGIGDKVKIGDCAYKAATVDELYIEHMKWYADFIHTEGPPAVRDYENNCLVIEHKMSKTVGENPDGSLIFEPTESDFQRIYTGRGEWIAETLEDARQMAIDFADSVS